MQSLRYGTKATPWACIDNAAASLIENYCLGLDNQTLSAADIPVVRALKWLAWCLALIRRALPSLSLNFTVSVCLKGSVATPPHNHLGRHRS